MDNKHTLRRVAESSLHHKCRMASLSSSLLPLFEECQPSLHMIGLLTLSARARQITEATDDSDNDGDDHHHYRHVPWR